MISVLKSQLQAVVEGKSERFAWPRGGGLVWNARLYRVIEKGARSHLPFGVGSERYQHSCLVGVGRLHASRWTLRLSSYGARRAISSSPSSAIGRLSLTAPVTDYLRFCSHHWATYERYTTTTYRGRRSIMVISTIQYNVEKYAQEPKRRGRYSRPSTS